MNITPEQFDAAFKKLPYPIREFIAGEDLGNITRGLGTKYQLHVDTVGAIDREVTNMLLGFENPTQFTNELRSIGIAQNQIGPIVQELNEKVFVPLQEKMRSGGEERNEGEAKTTPDAPAPSSPAQTYAPPVAPAPQVRIAQTPPPPPVASLPVYAPPAPEPLPAVLPPDPLPMVVNRPSVSQFAQKAAFPAYTQAPLPHAPTFTPPSAPESLVPTPRPLPPEIETALREQSAPETQSSPEVSFAASYNPLAQPKPIAPRAPEPDHAFVRTMAGDMEAVQHGQHPDPFIPAVAQTVPPQPVQPQPPTHASVDQFVSPTLRPSAIPATPASPEAKQREVVQQVLEKYGIDPYREPVE